MKKMGQDISIKKEGVFVKLIKNKVVLHSILWTVFFFIIVLAEQIEKKDSLTTLQFIKNFLVFLSLVGESYANTEILIPRYFKKKKYLLYSIFLALVLVGAAGFSVLMNFVILKDIDNQTKHSISSFFMHMFTAGAGTVFLTSFLYFISDWIKYQDVTIKLKETESEKILAELQTLKAQINPHFLFNTLNNLYSLSIEKSDKSPELILKLSDMMSYILYDCKVEQISLKQEIDFIENYLELEKHRFEDQVQVRFNHSNIDETISVAPLLFIPFVENAFKHGGSNDVLSIDIVIRTNADALLFEIQNSVYSDDMMKQKKKSGIGIENVKRRLNLLYPGMHSLKIEKNDESFNVKLTIVVK